MNDTEAANAERLLAVRAPCPRCGTLCVAMVHPRETDSSFVFPWHVARRNRDTVECPFSGTTCHLPPEKDLGWFVAHSYARARLKSVVRYAAEDDPPCAPPSSAAWDERLTSYLAACPLMSLLAIHHRMLKAVSTLEAINGIFDDNQDMTAIKDLMPGLDQIHGTADAIQDAVRERLLNAVRTADVCEGDLMFSDPATRDEIRWPLASIGVLQNLPVVRMDEVHSRESLENEEPPER